MPRMVDGSLLGAVKHPANHKPLIFCSMSMVAVGMLMVVFGGVIMLLDHVEMGPPHFDSQYERYAGSSLAHILGKFSSAGGKYEAISDLLSATNLKKLQRPTLDRARILHYSWQCVHT